MAAIRGLAAYHAPTLARHGMTEKEFVVATVDLLVEYFSWRRGADGHWRGSEEHRRRRLIKAAFKRNGETFLAPAFGRSDTEADR